MFWILILLCICCYGCSDEGIRITLHEVSEPSVTTRVPIEVQQLLWNDPDAEKEKLLAVEKDDTQPDGVAETIRMRICKAEQQRLYYTKYIDAGGIAIMGNAHVPDTDFLIARDITLRMTAKRPELRKMMSPASRYRTILVSILHSQTIGEIPEYTCPNHEPRSPGGVGGRFQSVTLIGSYYWGTFVHEFAHSIEAFISCYEQKTKYCYYDSGVTLQTLDFQNRLEAAYQQAIALGLWKDRYAETNPAEYWAEGVVMWFYGIGEGKEFPTHADFAAHDPLLAELIDEWFAKDAFWTLTNTFEGHL